MNLVKNFTERKKMYTAMQFAESETKLVVNM